jgi:hypothetical protein
MFQINNTFSRIFSNNVLNASYLCDVIRHFIFPVLFSRTFSICLFFLFFFYFFFSLTGNVISGQNTRKKGGTPNFRLCMCAPEGTSFGVTSLPVALSVMRNDTFCTTTIVVVQNVPVVHAHTITSVTSSQGRFRSRHFRLRTRSLPVAPPQQIWLELCPYTTHNLFTPAYFLIVYI